MDNEVCECGAALDELGECPECGMVNNTEVGEDDENLDKAGFEEDEA
ncbi:MAG: hypothetical protein V1664_04525 [Candidatus Uhrbacteria bacterium]